MLNYRAPIREIRFVLNEVFGIPALWASLPKLAESVDPDTVDAILEEAGKITSGVIAPINRTGDEQGCKWNDGAVTTPEGFKEAYQTIVDGGWNGLGGNPGFGGMGMPKTLVAQFEEMLQASNMALGLAPMLTAGACLALDAHGSEELKAKYLPSMYSGLWSGAMNLTEAHAGTDLGIIRTKAEPNDEEGSYIVTGTKIFITWGEHDMVENIIHLVLAKLPDAPKGPKGISLFLVPKLLVNEDGCVGERNGVTCGSIEKKMGIKGSATCVMNFDGAKGWLVGEPHKGLAAMFTMMNYERLGVGIQGMGAAEASLQSARNYALERLQSRAPTGAQQPEKAADPLIVHPDVRRMLLTMKSYVEGGRAFSTYVAQWLDIAKYTGDKERRLQAEQMVALLTPVAKAFLTDRGLEVCIIGQQVFGGHGYVREWGQEQLVRDVRITQIYEGTNGIQALDLMGRKVVLNQGRFFELFAQEVAEFIEINQTNTAVQPYLEPLAAALKQLESVTEYVIKSAAEDPNEVGAASVDYLDLFGLTALAYMWARIVKAAAPKADGDSFGFYSGKLKTARFYYDRLLPKTVSLAQAIFNGSDSIMTSTENEF
ncbi:acyl-CoA dehydrogenase C-terminal domain-containing protein [Marinobacter salarius]|uniref:acyl-CoA dehydrogenase C-terminal domain-containing protein n=1 Tax=Marinobacter salarius TaxID=1420917 RepID=UPI00273B5B94|nr:acyl-CoA dehydrogenase C-terminal domain-containing protein [Marinobacter salarius]MDP4532890.1 acyl-CoA dehydrogenase C-terminal domain-containing protein [Marinobacter salarius]